MWNKNRITNLLDINHPIIQAPMAGGITTSQLVASVSNAGGLGMIGAGYLNAVDLRQLIKDTKKVTSKPFGVNLFIPDTRTTAEEEITEAYDRLRLFRERLGLDHSIPVFPNDPSSYKEKLKVIMEEKVPICSFTFGVPTREVVNELKKENIILIGTATTVKEALINEELGMDAVVVQGSEAGGHRGTFDKKPSENLIGLMALIPQVVDHVKIPVIASGGIMDGRGVIASIFLGAEGVQMGSAFLTTVESGAHELHKEAILNATEEETVLTKVFSGKFARGLSNQFVVEMEESKEEIPAYPVQHYLTSNIRKEAAKQNKSEYMSLWSGQGVRLSKRQTVHELITGIVSQVNQLVKSTTLE